MQDNFRAEPVFASDCSNAVAGEGSSSKYAEPEAEGVMPVLRTRTALKQGSVEHRLTSYKALTDLSDLVWLSRAVDPLIFQHFGWQCEDWWCSNAWRSIVPPSVSH